MAVVVDAASDAMPYWTRSVVYFGPFLLVDFESRHNLHTLGHGLCLTPVLLHHPSAPHAAVSYL